MIQVAVKSSAAQLRAARHSLRDHLTADETVEPTHIEALETVANELLGAALETGIRETLTLRIEMFALLSSVRVHCPSNVELRDEPFGLRERVLEGFAFAWGKRTRADGSVDLWAEIARPARVRPSE
jgi:hypothetical protein